MLGLKVLILVCIIALIVFRHWVYRQTRAILVTAHKELDIDDYKQDCLLLNSFYDYIIYCEEAFISIVMMLLTYDRFRIIRETEVIKPLLWGMSLLLLLVVIHKTIVSYAELGSTWGHINGLLETNNCPQIDIPTERTQLVRALLKLKESNIKPSKAHREMKELYESTVKSRKIHEHKHPKTDGGPWNR